jgi:hypothetical protein
MLIPKPMPWILLRLTLIAINHIYLSLGKGDLCHNCNSLVSFQRKEIFCI